MKRAHPSVILFIRRRLESMAHDYIENLVDGILPGVKPMVHYYSEDEAEKVIKGLWGDAEWEKAKVLEDAARAREQGFRESRYTHEQGERE